MNIRRPYLTIGALGFAIAIPLWLTFTATWFNQLPPDFHYQADIASYDNFFDETTSTFSGEERSVTKFAYDVENKQGDVLTIKNVFDVRKVTGEKIFAVERLYGIDSKTGKHAQGFGDKDRDGYLFAPRHLRKNEPFTYWHINYDGPAHMTFVEEEQIRGLVVYRYETRYEGVRIDQTKNLPFLPDVGVTRGIELEPYLQIWIEPVSGHLVKYEDDTTAYYYDLQTGTRLHPWNHFGNRYTSESVANQIEIATQEKFLVTLVNGVVSALCALFVIALLLLHFCKRHAIQFLFIGTITVATVTGAVLWLSPKNTAPTPYTGPVEKLRIGVELGLLPVPMRIAEHNGYLKEQGLDVEVTDFSSGRAALAALLTEGKLDMATVAQTPIVLNSFERNDFTIIAAMVQSQNDVKILARKDRNINVPADLKGKIIGITSGSTGHYFFSLFLARHGLGLHDVTTVDIGATALPEEIAAGHVDAIATWEPNLYRASQLLGDNGLILESRATYREDFYFSVFKDWAKKNPKLLQRFLVAIDKANAFITENPKESQKIVAERLNIDPSFVASVWNDFSYELFLDQAILLTFEQQARWMLANKLTAKTVPSNYLDFIYFDALEAVKPAAVSIIH